MKTFYSILGAMLFVCGFALATGVDQNPIQCVYTLILMGCALVCFNRADRIGNKSQNQQKQKVYDYASGAFRDAA